jgi:predicted RNA polymerase sigma factor
MTWHLTKYALTKGIIKIPASEIEKKGSHVYWRNRACVLMFRANDGYTSADEAYARAIAMARKKIEANRKSTEKMEALIKEWENKC